LVIVLVFALGAAAPAFAQSYTIRALGPPPVPSTFSSTGKAINNRGEVLADGVFGPYNGTPSIFLPVADYGMAAGLDYLPFSGFTNFTGLSSGWIIEIFGGIPPVPFPRAFNDRGEILGTLTTPSHAGVWQNRQVRDLGTLGGSTSTSVAINQNGDVIGFSTTIPGNSTSTRHFIYLAGAAQMQPIFGLDEYGGLIGFNNQRQILARGTNGDAIWQNGVAREAAEFFGFDKGPAAVPDPNNPGVFYYPDGTYNQVNVTALNDVGEILGYITTTVIQNGTNAVFPDYHSFIYSPAGGHGFQPGLNYDVLRYESARFEVPRDLLVAWNNNGQMIYLTDYNASGVIPTYYFWDQGRSQPLQNLVPAGSGWTNLTPFSLNDRGEIVGQGSSNGIVQAFLLGLPPLSLSVSATPSRATLGDQIEVIVTMFNNNKDPGGVLTNVQLALPLTTSGSVSVKPNSIPAAQKPLTLGPGASFIYQQVFIATNYGTVSFGATASGNDPRGIVLSAAGTSAPVNIKLAADLMVKTADPADTVFEGMGQYQEVPDGEQDQTLPVGTNGSAGYVVRLLNGTPQARSFTLRATTNSFPHWTVQSLVDGASVLEALTGGGGWTTPELAPGGSVDLSVAFLPGPTAGIQEHKSLLIQALADDTSTDVLDAVWLHATLVAIPVEVTVHRLTGSGLTPSSIQAGSADLNAPLVPSSDPTQLADQPLIHGGLVADGVTPLLLKLAGDPARLAQFTNGYAFDVKATMAGGGVLAGDSLNQRVQALYNGVWAASTGIVLSASSPIAYVQILPILSDDVLLIDHVPEVQCLLTVVDKGSGDDAGQVRFAVRKPPIALIHGYASEGFWGADFKSTLGASRPLGLEDSPNNFVRTVRYGQDQLPSLQQYIGVPVLVNTAWSLEDCAVLANNAFAVSMAPVHLNWAFTRFDVVAHSQGGLLTRMLCSANSNLTLRQPFRNSDNFFRGRFHRVVTIGSPHNGSRLLRYLLDLDQRGLHLGQSIPATLVGNLMVGLNIAQKKFDPFGEEIRALNDPSPSAPWWPDPAVLFHLVRPVIDGGLSPGPGDAIPSYIALGLPQSGGGTAVIPRGSDGVVDFDSMGANVPPSSAAPNVFDIPPDNLISHAGPTLMFGSTAAEVDSPIVAQHVITALDTDQRTLVPGLIFSSFPLPPLLDDTQKALIDNYAKSGLFDYFTNLIHGLVPSPGVVKGPRPKGGGGGGSGATYEYNLNFPVSAPPQGNVQWFVEVFGPQGITSDGVSWQASGTNAQQVAVTVADAVVGDVVLYASYVSLSNTLISTTPFLVVSVPPAGVTLAGLKILPTGVSLPVGSVVPARIVALYSDGTSSLRFVPAGAVTATSSEAGVISVADPLNWQLLTAGVAQVSLTWQGLTATSQVTAFSTNAISPTLSISSAGNNSLTLSWPAYASAATLESNTNLFNPSGWQPVAEAPTDIGGQNVSTFSATNGAQFYRLRFQL
jgi:hypothetical protein